MCHNVGCESVQLLEMTVEASDGSEEEGVFERTQLPTEQELLEGMQARSPGLLTLSTGSPVSITTKCGVAIRAGCSGGSGCGREGAG